MFAHKFDFFVVSISCTMQHDLASVDYPNVMLKYGMSAQSNITCYRYMFLEYDHTIEHKYKELLY